MATIVHVFTYEIICLGLVRFEWEAIGNVRKHSTGHALLSNAILGHAHLGARNPCARVLLSSLTSEIVAGARCYVCGTKRKHHSAVLFIFAGEVTACACSAAAE